jgi:hypothetical protein
MDDDSELCGLGSDFLVRAHPPPSDLGLTSQTKLKRVYILRLVLGALTTGRLLKIPEALTITVNHLATQRVRTAPTAFGDRSSRTQQR